MCGIIGLIDRRGARRETATRMLGAIAHRGPDGLALEELDHGRVILGHARLAIVDLSPTGAQPMTLAGSELWITFNGEIYNHRSLRKQLEAEGQRFRSTSDTEVLLAGYARWGTDVLDRLDGIFAFGLWDGAQRRLWLARDHLGVKPLYYTRDANRFAFASEPKALLPALGGAPTPDRQSLRDFLSLGYIPGARTAFAEINKLEAGHSLVWDGDTTRTSRYWNAADFASDRVRDEAAVIGETTQLLDRSTESQLESDVPVGVLVSGGLDSSAVTSSVSRAREHLRGFVLGFDDERYDERRYAEILGRACGMDLHERVLRADDLPRHLEDAGSAYDEPFADSSQIPTLALFAFVRDERYKVVLGGDGGDELYGGYRRYDKLLASEGHSQAAWPMKLMGAPTWQRAIRIAARPGRYARPAWYSYYERIRIFSFDEQRSLLQSAWAPETEAELTWPFSTYWNTQLDTVKAAQLFDLKTYLPEDILTKVDRASMHHGVEARVPLLARRMVEHAMQVATSVHRAEGRRKHVLKRVMADRLPDELLSNRKKGFGLPLELTVGERLRRWAQAFDQSALVRAGVLKPHLPPQLAGNLDQLWTLFTLDRWWSRWLQ